MKDYDYWDRFFCNNPLIGKVMRRMYAYFKRHTAITDAMHVSLGLGLGLLVAGSAWLYVGFTFIIIGLLGHIHAFIRGGE